MTISDEKEDMTVTPHEEEEKKPNESTYPSLLTNQKNRAVAKHNIVQSWASRRSSSSSSSIQTHIERRQQQQQQQQRRPLEEEKEGSTAFARVPLSQQRKQKQNQHSSSVIGRGGTSQTSRALPVCVFLRNAWDQTTSSWTHLLQQNQLNKQHALLKSTNIDSNNNVNATAKNNNNLHNINKNDENENSRPFIDGKKSTKTLSSFSREHQHQQQQLSQTKKLTYFESVNQHQIARAVASQVESLQEEKSLLMSVLPAGYDIHKAIQSSSLDRKRAFLLLDLAAIIRTSVQLQYQLSTVLLPSHRPHHHHHQQQPGQQQQRQPHYDHQSAAATPPTKNTPRNKTKKVEMQFAVHLNRDSALLELLCRLGISLRCTSNQDVTAAQMAIQKNKTGTMVDHAGVTRKPDGYLRRMAKHYYSSPLYHNDMDGDARHTNSSIVSSFAVDGPDEIHRIQTTLKRSLKQKISTVTASEHQQHQMMHSFVLKLPKDTTSWEDLILTTYRAALEHNSTLEGVSIHLEYYYNELQHMTKTLQKVVQYLQEEKKKHEEENTLLSNETIMNNTNIGSNMIRIDMTGLPEQSQQPHVYDWIQEFNTTYVSLPNNALRLTVDVSYSLVSHAGALCTRIIGVKRSAPPVSALSTCSDNDVAKGLNDEEEKAGQGESDSMVHYYIDDGCYGSLQKNNSSACSRNDDTEDEFHPVPLFYNSNNNDPTCQLEGEEITIKKSISTVWGPTCDGLDRVCRAVPLPHLQVDDWLVFPHLGCGGFGGGLGLGTAFNGFEPPDTVYCVLGYFR